MIDGVGATQESAARAVHAAEVLVERAVVAAERSLAHRIGQRGLRVVMFGLRAAWTLATIAFFLFGVAVLATRYYLLPHIDDWRTRIEASASSALKAPVTVGHIEADWQGLQPRLTLRDVALRDAGGGNALTLPEVEVVVSWTTLLAWQPRMQSITVFAPELEVRRLHDRRWTVAGIVIDPQAQATDNSVADWVLAQHYISIRDARVHFVDELGTAAALAGSAAASPASAAADASATKPPAEPAAAESIAETKASAMDFTEVNLVLSRGLTAHHVAVQLRPPAQLAGRIDVRAEFTQAWGQPTAHFSSWSGRLYAQFDYADLARLDALTHLVPAPARLDRATGALRAWIDFSGLDVKRMRADVALNDVAAQLRPDLQPLRLHLLEGRITQASWSDRDGDVREISLTGLRMDGPDQLRLPATDLLLRTTQAPAAGGTANASMHFEASRIVLSDWSRLALQVPLPADWLALIERTAARGTLEDLQADLGAAAGPQRAYALRARFSGLGFRLGTAPPPAGTAAGAPVDAATDASADPSTDGAADTAPGPSAGASSSLSAAGSPATPAPEAATATRPYSCENLAGTVDLNQDSGTLRIDSAHGLLRLPALFEEPAFSFDTLAARVRWKRSGAAHIAVDVDAFSATNEDLDVSGSGSYEQTAAEPARLDLSGRLARGRVNAVYRYLPHVTAAPARAWIHGALLDGAITDGSFYLHGDPLHFPFGDPKTGEFHAALHLQDGLLDVAPRPADAPPPAPGTHASHWPVLSAIDADVVFDRNHLTVSGRSAKAYGYELSGITARLPDLEHADQHLFVDGQGSGPLAELLRYLVASPVNNWTGGWLAPADGSGTARLKIKLDIPLAHSVDTVVNGAVTFRNNNLVLRPDIAPFSAVNGELGFNQRGIRLSGISAGYIGGDVRISGDTQPDGTITIQASGTATPQGAKRQVEPALLRRVLDRTRGTFHYGAALAIHHGTLGLQIDSDLAGLAADLPEPFRKAAAEQRPLHIETVPVAGADPARETLRATLGTQLTVELHRVAGAGDGMRIERGAIAIGGHANVPDKGLLLLVDQPHVDVDRWERLLGLNAPAAAGAAAAGVDATGVRSAPAASGADTEGVDIIVVHTADLAASGKTLNNVSLSARRDPDQSWYADIDSDQASGSVHWVGTHGSVPGRVTARLAKLVIPESDKKQVTDLLDAPPTDFPALDIVAEQLELGSYKLGRLEVDAQNGPGGAASGAGPGAGAVANTAARADSWNLQKLTLTNPDGKLSASGSWQRDGSTPGRKMSVKFVLDFTNGGGVLSRFGIPNAIRNGKGKLEGELSWRGSPLAINYPSLSGKLHLAAEKGQFLKADAGVRGRLLGVFSLQSLTHRVMGDFRDLFSEGFAFDSISASANVNNGTLTTDDFIMKGLNAVVRIKGDADINAETQNLEVVVIPEINAGTASLAYILVNPAIGVGTFVANYLFRKPLQAALTNVYEVSGSWADPKVERLKIESRTPATGPAGDQ
jgi:uncharacterized protein (TIGR02099 family)